VAAALCGLLGACAATNGSSKTPRFFSSIIPKSPLRASKERLAIADLVPISTEGSAVAANAAREAVLEPEGGKGYDRVGMASWYGGHFHGRQTADGEVFDRAELTAAHLTLPLPSYVRVTNLENNRSIVLRVNDRGPYVGNRLIDVSEQAAEMLAFRRGGSTKVRVQYVSPAPRQAEDAATLLSTYRGPTLPVADAMAFAPKDPEVQGSRSVGAFRRLTWRASADARILMAFDVARDVN
jgi:rare lipoprotein A